MDRGKPCPLQVPVSHTESCLLLTHHTGEKGLFSWQGRGKTGPEGALVWETGDLSSRPQRGGTWACPSFNFLSLSFFICKIRAVNPSLDLRLPFCQKGCWRTWLLLGLLGHPDQSGRETLPEPVSATLESVEASVSFSPPCWKTVISCVNSLMMGTAFGCLPPQRRRGDSQQENC